MLLNSSIWAITWLVNEQRHHEARVAGGAAEVHEAALGEDDDLVAVVETPHVGAGLELVAGRAGAGEAGHVDLVVEVADVADDRVVLHLAHVVGR